MGSATLLAVLLFASAIDERPKPIAPPPTAPASPPAAPPGPAWADPEREIEAAAEGSLDTCELLALPLGFLPGVGEVIDFAAGWLCIIPAAMAVDYVAVHHGGRDSFLWQSGVALAAASIPSS